MTARMLTYHYISALSASLVALFWVACALLSKGGSENLLQSHVEKFVQHMSDKIAWIYSQLDTGLLTGTV